MLSFINDLSNALLSFIKDDPVRPEISTEFRVSENRFVAALHEDETPHAIVCVSLHDFVPTEVDHLSQTSVTPDTAIFYSIWSYQPGAGARLLRETVEQIKVDHPSVKNFVTLSPKTEMARRFHTNNGASVLNQNANTVNYDYTKRAQSN
jgi:hypothetical protein